MRGDRNAMQEIGGLWLARGRFGPAISGSLTLCEVEEGWVAEIAGWAASVRREGDHVFFNLADGQGSFQGRVYPDRIVGHWIQPVTSTHGCAYATPVVLHEQAPQRWRGRVAPVDEVTTFYLQIEHGADGRLDAFLRNPEVNAGLWLNVERVEVDGRRVRLRGRPTSGAVADPAVASNAETIVAEGSHDAERGRLSIDFPGHGGGFEFRRVNGADEDGFHPRGWPPARYSYRPPSEAGDGWQVGTIDEVGIDRDAIGRFVQMVIDTPIDSVHAPAIHSVLVVRHGKLVLEEYFHGCRRDELHDTRSAGKSLSSLLTGAAILHGAPISLSTPVYETLGRDDPDPRKRALAVEHLLTMSSGLDSDDWDPTSPGREDLMQGQTDQPDWHRFALDLGMVRSPGKQAVYSAATCNLIGGVLSRVTGRRLPELFHDLIAEPLGIERYAMNLMPNGEVYFGGGIRLRPRDFLKLGQLMLDGGRWRDQQIVGPDWVRQSITPRYKLDYKRGPYTDSYGFLWWINDFPYRDRTVRAFSARGNGGQFVFGVPELDLVIAFNGGNYSDRIMNKPRLVDIPEHILPAVMS
jgi:CubicO group peptidase (beta-lactamase class C family)